MSPVYKQRLEKNRGTGPKPYRYDDPRPRPSRTRPKNSLVSGKDPTQPYDVRKHETNATPNFSVPQQPQYAKPHQTLHDGDGTFYHPDHYYRPPNDNYNQHEPFIPEHEHYIPYQMPIMFPHHQVYGPPSSLGDGPVTYSTPNQRRQSHSASYSHGSRSRTSARSYTVKSQPFYPPRRMRETVPFYGIHDDGETFTSRNAEEFDEFQALYSHRVAGHGMPHHNYVTEETTMSPEELLAMEEQDMSHHRSKSRARMEEDSSHRRSKSRGRSKSHPSKSIPRSSKSVESERRRSITLSRLSDIEFSSTELSDSEEIIPPHGFHSPHSPYGLRRGSTLPGVPSAEIIQTVVHQPLMGSDIESLISSNLESGVVSNGTEEFDAALSDEEDDMGIQKRMRVRDAHRIDSGIFWFLADHFAILRLMNRPYHHETGIQAKDIRSWQDIDIKRIFRGWLELQRKNQSWTNRKPEATVFQVTNSAKEVLVHFENDQHRYWIPEIIAKNIRKQQREKETKREPAKSKPKKEIVPMNIDSLDSMFSGATGAKANVVKKKKKLDNQWLEIPVLRSVLEEASEEDQNMICNGLRLTPLSLHLGGYYLDYQHCPHYSDMPGIKMGYRAETKNYVFSCLSCCLLPPSNKFFSLWLSFAALVVQITLSSITLRDYASSLPSSLLILLILQLFFGTLHFGATWMYHIASNFSHAVLLAWWRRCVCTFALWMASCFSYLITVIGFCDSYTTTIIFTSLIWTGALIIFFPMLLTTAQGVVDKRITKFLQGSISFCTICFICVLFILNNSKYLLDQLLMLLPLFFSLILLQFRRPEKWFPKTFFFQFVWTSVNLWLLCRCVSLVFYHSLTQSFLDDWDKVDFEC